MTEKSKAKRMNSRSNNRVVIMRLLLTPEERAILERAADEKTGGNMSEYVRRILFPRAKVKGARDEQHQDNTAQPA